MKLPSLSRQQISNIVVLVCLVLFVLIVLVNLFGSDRVAGWVERQLGFLPVMEQPLIEGEPS